jgi:hypothetical protein
VCRQKFIGISLGNQSLKAFGQRIGRGRRRSGWGRYTAQLRAALGAKGKVRWRWGLALGADLLEWRTTLGTKGEIGWTVVAAIWATYAHTAQL